MARKPENRTQIKAAAFHEAGHAATYYRLGVPFESVSIVPDPKGYSLGRVVVKHPRWYRPDTDSYPSSPNHARSRVYCENCIIAGIVGHLAEARFRRRMPRRFSYSADLETCFNEAAHWFGSPEAISAYVHLCWILAKEFVGHGRYWKGISALASALLKRKELDYEEAANIFREASLGPRRPVPIIDLTGELSPPGTAAEQPES